MNLLAIDTSTEIASVALLVGEELTVEEQPSPKTHAQMVLPLIDRLLVKSGMHLNQLDAVVFGCGPGSFTGLRIACSIAKGLAYAHDLGLIPVSSLGAIAFAARQQSTCPDSPVLAVLDARMHELYWSYFPGNTVLASEQVNAASDIRLPNQQGVILAGVGVENYWPELPADLKNHITAKLTCYPNAGSMIQLAQTAGIAPIAADLAQPIYVRNQVTQGATGG